MALLLVLIKWELVLLLKKCTFTVYIEIIGVQRSLNLMLHFWKSVTFWIFNIFFEPLNSETATPSANISKILSESTDLVHLVKLCTPIQTLISLLGAEISRHIPIWFDSDFERYDVTYKKTTGAVWCISHHLYIYKYIYFFLICLFVFFI